VRRRLSVAADSKRRLTAQARESVVLRPLEERDLELTLSWRNRDEARRWFKNANMVETDAHRAWFDRYLAKSDDFTFIVEHVATGAAIGQAAIYDVDLGTRRAEVGRFLVAPEWAGRGLMKQACLATIDIAREQLFLKALYLEVFVTNLRAIAVYRACGFAFADTCDGRLARMDFRLE
jgi:diamine N-acetyltransferase